MKITYKLVGVKGNYHFTREHDNANLDTMYKTATICDKKMNSLKEHNYPKTAEEYYYRKTFEEYYKGLGENIPYFWMPKYTDATDSSARTLDIYKNN